MTEIEYFLVDVFTSCKYGGNQLAVFIDFDDIASDKDMLNIARELNFPEITFIKKRDNNQSFDLRIFTPEYEVPFAGHPLLGTAFIISKYLLTEPRDIITLNLKDSDIDISLTKVDDIDNSKFIMEQSTPEFIGIYEHEYISKGLNLELDFIDTTKPIEEISTGLPYIIIPIVSLEKMGEIRLNSEDVIRFLTLNGRYKTNSRTGLSTSLFFFTEESFEEGNRFNSRMFCIENGGLVEDAATGSANGSFLAYLLKHGLSKISTRVEQGFQINRRSYIDLYGEFKNGSYILKVGGQVVDVGRGMWKM
ncbi:MAG: phenazine biosynthesis protein [Candidatus Cloacimonadota bacterium]|nr:MAG: phenazine biosynthesis protein [Candidatus Cloacimonadota bacterium]PIE78687.1 MAG: phenazine biosynthesis protein [Candidatus Delongbacteria bacterium]